MKKRFVTLFPYTYNVNLMKDVGCIPYVMFKDHEFESSIVCFNNDDYGYLNEHVKGLNLEFLRPENERLACIKYVIRNAKKIDVLNMYHLSVGKSLMCLIIYKIINKKGISYLKLDIDLKTIHIIENYNILKKSIIRWMARHVDIISAESRSIIKRVERILNRKIEYIPNGILEYDHNLMNIDLNSFKESVFLTVGRLGTEQKATEHLVDAFLNIRDRVNWNLWLVGKCEEKFKLYINDKLQSYPDLHERIIIFGEISDKAKLTEIYRKSKVFVLPSKWEGFSLASIEALANGCLLILSDQVSPAEDFINLGKFCEIVEYGNIKMLENRMTKIAGIQFDANSIAPIAVDNFCWHNICRKIMECINLVNASEKHYDKEN